MTDDLIQLLSESDSSPDPLLETLVLKIKEARDQYYNGTPTLSDSEYDALEDKLRELDPQNPLLQDEIGAKPQGTWPKCELPIPMGSLNKIMPDKHGVANGIREWWQKTERALH
jgi:NAD-dependent DNA ligase